MSRTPRKKQRMNPPEGDATEDEPEVDEPVKPKRTRLLLQLSVRSRQTKL